MKLSKDNAGYWKKWNVTKPCPFCGGKAQIDIFEEPEAYEHSYYYQGERLTCKCGIFYEARKEDYETEQVPYYDIQYNVETREKMRNDLLKKWNKRFTNLT